MEFGLGVFSATSANSAVPEGPRAKASAFTSQGLRAVEFYQVMFVLAIMAPEGHQKPHYLYYAAMVGDVDALWVA